MKKSPTVREPKALANMTEAELDREASKAMRDRAEASERWRAHDQGRDEEQRLGADAESRCRAVLAEMERRAKIRLEPPQ
jgi:hypothetical protein